MITQPASRTASIEILESRIAPATIIGVDANSRLLSFDSASPGAVTVVTVTGLGAGETLEAVDFRPATGQLYGLGIVDLIGTDEGRIYTINPATGAATQVGAAPFSTTLTDNSDWGFDFNPAVDRIRLVNDGDQSLRINPDTGALAGTDTALTPNTASLIGAAYDRNFAGTPQTTLFGIDFATDSLVRIGGVNGVPSPNGGVVTQVGPLGVDVNNFRAGFDIESRTGTAYAALRSASGANQLFTVNLTTGAATLIGTIGTGTELFHGITVALPNDLTLVSPTVARYIDQDGDAVTVRVSKGTLGAQDFTFATGQKGSQLRLLNLSDDGQEFAGASLSIIGVRRGANGDGYTNVGHINATGVDLGHVVLRGDLAQIDAGDATLTTPGLRSLTVASLGNFGTATQSATTASTQSDIAGALGRLDVKTDITRATVVVNGAIGSVTIGGDIIGNDSAAGGGVTATGNIGPVTILGSVQGGAAGNSGIVDAGGTMGNVFIRGSILGGAGADGGLIESTGKMGALVIRGNVIGGAGDGSGRVHSAGGIASVNIAGSIIGGTAAGVASGLVESFGGAAAVNNIGPVKIGGSLIGNAGQYSGSIFANGKIASVNISGSLIGGAGSEGGSIVAGLGIGNVAILGSTISGAGNTSGSVLTFSGGPIADVTITGAVIGSNTLSGILSDGTLGAVKIGGTMRGGRISAEGVANSAGLAIKSITVGGSVKNALILGGYDQLGVATNPDASIGAVAVGGNWIASSIASGVAATDPFFGNGDDVKITEGVADLIVSRIASIVIGGYAIGTPSVSGDHFGFVAQRIGSLKVGTLPYPLVPGSSSAADIAGYTVGPTLDLRVREV